MHDCRKFKVSVNRRIGRQWANFDPQVPAAGRKHSTDIFPKKRHRAEDLKLVVAVKVL
jgi:hypothetical protein